MDITAHHFDAPDGLRDYVKQHTYVQTEALTFHELTCRQHAAYFLQLQLSDWAPVEGDWWSVTADLRGPDGHTIGRRPAMVYAKKYDIPTYTTFKIEGALFSLGMRTVSVA